MALFGWLCDWPLIEDKYYSTIETVWLKKYCGQNEIPLDGHYQMLLPAQSSVLKLCANKQESHFKTSSYMM